MLLDYVDAAERFSRCQNKEEFIGQFGESTRAMQGLYEGMSQDVEQIGQAVFELHKRHGDGVMRVVSNLLGNNPGRLLRGEINPNSAVALISRTGLERCGVAVAPSESTEVSPWTGGEYMFKPHGDMWLVRYRGGEIYPIKDQRGMTHIHTLLQRPGDFISTDSLTAIAEGHEVAGDSLQTDVPPWVVVFARQLLSGIVFPRCAVLSLIYSLLCLPAGGRRLQFEHVREAKPLAAW